ncbi:tripeptidyl-peptidase C. Serine peptidase. MEROPS family S33 [Streptomyces sp. 2131.1]|uniref:alpha/beta hydrolase n=1 Tax=Streptomyces sp. 2131.1 TaxID=1855346 RepID=UPI00089A6631|nr:alpha/beta hydrolase [Streptomyces sp. 2131.1]SEE41617.1 tripeptidyl-peptidase C. Serine peptidase. MEROPS family S33 [Streptomyces sp. 2131.1]
MSDADPIRSRRPGLSAGALIVAGILLAATGAVGAWLKHDTTGRSAEPRTELTAKNPPAGLPAALTTGQHLHWSRCTSPPTARKGYDCATMKAPLDYRKADGRTIDVALIRRKATGPNGRRIGSLVFNFGGPGVSGVSGLPDFLNQYEPLLDRYDLVSFDPRGVGATIPVRCGKTSDDTGYEGAEACAEHSGAVLPYIGTSHTARDLDLMRYLLGDERLNYFGVSYGTALGAVYAHLYPEHVGRVVLEASVDPTEDHVEEQVSQAEAVQAAFDRFATHCAARIRHCPTGDGPEEAARRMARLADRLKKKPAPAGGGMTLDAYDLAYAVADHLDYGTDEWPALAKALTALIDDNDGRPLSKGADDVGSADRSESPPDNSRAAQTAITCADSSLRHGFEQLDKDEARVKAASSVFGATWSGAVYLCFEWPFDGERSTLQVNADGASPVLVVGGTGDPTTPYSGARHMARALGEGVGVLLTAEEEGHGTYPQNRCVTKNVDRYLLTGRTPPPGTVCRGSMS